MSESSIRILLEIRSTASATPRRVVCRKRRISIGRSSSMDVTIANEVVSSHHLTLSWSHLQVMVRDESSTNGTVLNGHRLTSGTAVPVEVGDDITIESVRIHVADILTPSPTYEDQSPTLADDQALEHFQRMLGKVAGEDSADDIIDSTDGKQRTSVDTATTEKLEPTDKQNQSPNSRAIRRRQLTGVIILTVLVAVITAAVGLCLYALGVVGA